MNFNKNEVTSDILTLTLEKAGIPEEKITPELVDIFKEELIKNGIIDNNNILKKNVEQTTKLLENLVFEDQTLNEHSIIIKENFVENMIEKGSRRIEIRNGDNEPYVNKIRAFVSEEEFQKIYFGLRNNLIKRTLYKCDVDKDKFISECINEINEYLQYFKIHKKINIATGKAVFSDAQIFEMEKSGDKTFDIDLGIEVLSKSDFEIVNYIMYHTMLPRLVIFKILNGITKREALNFQDILDRVTQKILIRLNDEKASNITSYEVIDGYELDDGQIFATDTISEDDFDSDWKVFKSDPNRKKALNEFYKMDSKGEREFADKLEANENIILFTKLKKGGFVIDTPYGNYSPDWAIVCKKEGLELGAIGIYFIVETKAGKLEKDLNEVEINKIECGKLHFKAVSELVKFDWVNSYEDFKSKFGVKESI